VTIDNQLDVLLFEGGSLERGGSGSNIAGRMIATMPEIAIKNTDFKGGTILGGRAVDESLPSMHWLLKEKKVLDVWRWRYLSASKVVPSQSDSSPIASVVQLTTFRMSFSFFLMSEGTLEQQQKCLWCD